MESASSGLLAGINLARQLAGRPTLVLPETTMLGALARYVSGYTGKDFQPMGPISGCCRPCRREFGTSGSGTWPWPSGGFPSLEAYCREMGQPLRESAVSAEVEESV